MPLDLSSLQRAVSALEQTLQAEADADADPRLSGIQRNAIRSGVVQHFELTYELCWKFMKRWLVGPGGRADLDGLPRKELFRIAAQERLIDDVAAWFEFHTARNLTAHTYDKAVSDQVVAAGRRFLQFAVAFAAELERRNA